MKDELFEIEIDVSETNNIQYYEEILSHFSEWPSVKRDIKIMSVLENRKIEFEISQITTVLPNSTNNSLWGQFESGDTILTLSRVCFVINSMSFILMAEQIIKLTLKIQVLTTQYGKILSQLIKDNCNIKIKQLVAGDCVKYFYVDNFTTAA